MRFKKAILFLRQAIPRNRKHRLALAVGVVTLLCIGCEPVRYYGQAARGHLGLLASRRAVQKVLNDPTTPSLTRQRLALVGELKAFAARELGLISQGHYEHYADLEREHVVWNVYAAPEFSVEAHEWWYPIVGRLKYRGYFHQDAAENMAEKMRRKGYDAHVGGVTAYSTLGWFQDPLLNTFLMDPPEELADTLFHELAHQRLFFSGDTDFNEAFAVAVAEEGVRRWLRQQGDLVALERHARDRAAREQFLDFLLQARDRLENLYASMEEVNEDGFIPSEPSGPLSLARQQKSDLLAELAEEWSILAGDQPALQRWNAWWQRPVNNARFNTVDSYHRLVPEFEAVLAQYHGNFEAFFQALEALEDLKKEERLTALRQLASPL